MKRIPVVMCIDVEPKERRIARNARNDWDGFASADT
jgi:hypothetical protein